MHVTSRSVVLLTNCDLYIASNQFQVCCIDNVDLIGALISIYNFTANNNHALVWLRHILREAFQWSLDRDRATVRNNYYSRPLIDVSPLFVRRFKSNFYGFSLKPFWRIVIRALERCFQVFPVKLSILWPNYRSVALPSSATKLLESSNSREVNETAIIFLRYCNEFTFSGAPRGTSEHGHVDRNPTINRETSKMGGVGSTSTKKNT